MWTRTATATIVAYSLFVIAGLALAIWLAYQRRLPSNRGPAGNDRRVVKREDEAAGIPSIPLPAVLHYSKTVSGEAVKMGRWRTDRRYGREDEETGTGRPGAWGRETMLREYGVVEASGGEGVDEVQSVREFV